MATRKKTLKEDKISKANRLEIFCLEFLFDFNATRAAEASGYSKKTAAQIGSRLLKNVKVQEILAVLKKRLLEKKELRIEDILEILKTLSHSNVLDYVKDGTGETGLVEFKKPSELTREEGSAVEAFEYDKDNKVKYKFWSKPKALELAGRYHGMFVDNLKVKGDFTHTHDVSMKKLRDAINAINAIRGKGNKRKS